MREVKIVESKTDENMNLIGYVNVLKRDFKKINAEREKLQIERDQLVIELDRTKNALKLVEAKRSIQTHHRVEPKMHQSVKLDFNIKGLNHDMQNITYNSNTDKFINI